MAEDPVVPKLKVSIKPNVLFLEVPEDWEQLTDHDKELEL